MLKINFRRIMSILTAVVLIFTLAGCGNSTNEEETTTLPPAENASEAVNADAVTTTEAPTTEAPTTVPETTTQAPGEAIQHIVDTLESKTFYLSGQMDMQSGDSINAQMTCDGDNYRMVMDSKQMKLSMIYLDGNPYVVNNSTNSYILFTEDSIDSLDKIFNSFSSYGISFSSADISEMKGMMADFDTNMDFSGYIEDGELFEFKKAIDGVEHLCTAFKTDYGAVYIYTLDGTLRYIDMYDAEGLRQMHMTVNVFLPQVLTPITLNGLTLSPSILHLFGLAQ